MAGNRPVRAGELLNSAEVLAAVDSLLEPLALLHAVRDNGVIVDFTWEYINEAGAAALSFAVTDLIGAPLLEKLPAHRDGLFQDYCQVVETGEPLVVYNHGFNDTWGTAEVRPMLFDIRAVKVGDGFAVSWRDRTEAEALRLDHLRLKEDFHSAEATFETAFEYAPIGMAIVGLDGQFLRVNRKLCKITGYNASDLTNLRFQDITYVDDLDNDVALAGKLISGEMDSYQIEKRYITAIGHIIWVSLSGAMVRDENGDPMHFIAQVEDISLRKRDEELLQRLANRDTLTGIANRRKFDHELGKVEDSAERFGQSGTLILLDLDGLKTINDQHGHARGDNYLKCAADIVKSKLRLTDVFARIGGDEFGIILPHTNVELGTKIAESLVTNIAEKCQGTVSIGVARIDSAIPGSALERADQAMYEAKRAGGNQYRTEQTP